MEVEGGSVGERRPAIRRTPDVPGSTRRLGITHHIVMNRRVRIDAVLFPLQMKVDIAFEIGRHWTIAAIGRIREFVEFAVRPRPHDESTISFDGRPPLRLKRNKRVDRSLTKDVVPATNEDPWRRSSDQQTFPGSSIPEVVVGGNAHGTRQGCLASFWWPQANSPSSTSETLHLHTCTASISLMQRPRQIEPSKELCAWRQHILRDPHRRAAPGGDFAIGPGLLTNPLECDLPVPLARPSIRLEDDDVRTLGFSPSPNILTDNRISLSDKFLGNSITSTSPIRRQDEDRRIFFFPLRGKIHVPWPNGCRPTSGRHNGSA